MSFNGSEGRIETLSDASGWTKNYRNTVPAGSILGHFVGKDKILQILNQQGCVGIRTYYAIDNSGNNVLVLVGCDANENDLANGIIVEHGVPSPPTSGNANPLNS